MHNAAGESPSPPAKRLRRPSVRLYQPYYEIPIVQPPQWKVTSKKPRTIKNAHPKSKEINKNEEINDDDIAIGDWKSGKRVGSSNLKKCGSEKSQKNEEPSYTSNGEDEEEEEDEEDEEDEGVRNGVRVWLDRLGLGKYGRLFEVHGVDEQVLPLLTLEDLKDMGINQVGIRRKLFSSIQKL